MQPYYVVVLMGDVDESGTPQKFGLLGADDPKQAEDLVLKLAKENQDKACSFGVLQLYRSYPATLIAKLNEDWARREIAESAVRRQGETITDLRDSLARMQIELRKARKGMVRKVKKTKK